MGRSQLSVFSSISPYYERPPRRSFATAHMERNPDDFLLVCCNILPDFGDSTPNASWLLKILLRAHNLVTTKQYFEFVGATVELLGQTGPALGKVCSWSGILQKLR